MNNKTMGIRNRNPLNLSLRHGRRCLGLDCKQPYRKECCRFRNVAYCYRAAIIEICKFVIHFGANTPEKIIEQWLPRHKKRRDIYLACICGRSRLLPNEQISPTGMQIPRLLAAIARQESGSNIVPETIYEIRKKFNV